MSPLDSKLEMLQNLAPNAMKAYKRKKLLFFPSTGTNDATTGHTEMDLDSGDGNIHFENLYNTDEQRKFISFTVWVVGKSNWGHTLIECRLIPL